MARAPDMQLPYANWPAEDRTRWTAANRPGADPFDDCGPAAHLAEPTRRNLQGSYGRFLGFIATKHPRRLKHSAEARLDRKIIADYVAFRRPTCSASGMAADLHHLRLALRFIRPDVDWSWLLTIAKRIGANAKRKPPKHHLVTSERLYALGIELMDQAVAKAAESGEISKTDAFDYRDGLLIALLALIPLRRRTVAALRIDQQLVKSDNRWELEIPAKDMKARRAVDYPISSDLSQRIDLYLGRFRNRIPGAAKHDGLWASNKGYPMDDGTIYDTVRRRTAAAFGFPVNLHRFRLAAGTFWSIHDPVNVRGVKDLLGHASFVPTEKYYIISTSRTAGHALRKAVDRMRRASIQHF
jgi:integrase/recombinase XerD